METTAAATDTRPPGRRNKQEIFEDIYERARDRLNQPGQIKPGDIYTLVEHTYSYSVSNRIFREIMNHMVAMKRAEHLSHGIWKITKVGKN